MSGFLDGMDEATLQLVIQMQQEDIRELQDQGKGKAKESDRSDADVAFDTYQAELVSVQTFAADQAMSRRIAQQEGTYPPAESSCPVEIVTEDLVAEEIVAADDVHTACDNDVHDNDSIVDMPESSSWGASRESTRSCISCHGGPNDLYLVLCGHLYCVTCLQKLFQLSLVDESLFPPRCCRKPIPMDQAQHILPKQLMQEFSAKEIELSTVNRTYCHQPRCSAFIPPISIEGDVANCPACQAKTCVLCKSMAHDDVCKNDTATQEVLKLAAEKKWPRCNKCRAIVELNMGCYHMSESFPGILAYPSH
ncbi:IBR finger domain-containing protein [Colletotrichum camelliae]|nr:IBR finger domain-containing protein [Colletotrichum camelliae]